MKQKIFELCFVGDRNYVHAAKILQYAIIWIQREHQLPSPNVILIRRYKQPYIVNGAIELMPASQTEPLNTLRANISVEIDNQIFDYKIITNSGTLPRYSDTSYRQTNYQKLDETSAIVFVPKVEDFWEIIKEAVQLSKTFHIHKYNNSNIEYKFWVGGFESLKPFKLDLNKPLEIKCQILREFGRQDKLYNQIKIIVSQSSQINHFFLPFIGKKI